MANKEIILTPEGRQKLVDELAYREGERRDEIVERIKEARGFGDLSENAEYDAAKEEQSQNESRVNEIRQILVAAKVVERGEGELSVSIHGRARGCQGQEDLLHHRGDHRDQLPRAPHLERVASRCRPDRSRRGRRGLLHHAKRQAPHVHGRQHHALAHRIAPQPGAAPIQSGPPFLQEKQSLQEKQRLPMVTARSWGPSRPEVRVGRPAGEDPGS